MKGVGQEHEQARGAEVGVVGEAVTVAGSGPGRTVYRGERKPKIGGLGKRWQKRI